jgi:hypothetical protein
LTRPHKVDKKAGAGYYYWQKGTREAETRNTSKSKGGETVSKRAATDSLESKLDAIREQVWSLFSSSGDMDVGVVATFEDAVILKDYQTGLTYEMEYALLDGQVTFGEAKEVDNVYVTKRMMERNPKAAFKDLETLLDTFDDWATGTFTGCVNALEGHPGVDDPNALCAWLHKQATGEWPAEKAKGPAEAELTGPIVMKNAAKKIAYAAVLVPGEPDHDNEIVTAEKIEAAAHEWMADYQNVDLQHSLNNVGRPVESYVLPVDLEVEAYGQKMSLPKGSWIMASKFEDDVWDRVEKGELTGFSVMGIRRAAFKEMNAAEKGLDEAAMKRTLLKDLGPDWVPAYVSVVSEPCVPKAKFFAFKEKPQEEPEPKTFVEKLKGLFTAEKEGRKFSAATLSALQKASDALNDLIKQAEEQESSKSLGGGIDVDEAKVQELINASVKEALEPITSKLEELTAAKEPEQEEGAVKSEEENTEPAEKGTENQETENNEPDPIEVLKAEFTSRLDAIEGLLKPGSSRAVKGQDDKQNQEPERPVIEGRDAYGRSRPKQDK